MATFAALDKRMMRDVNRIHDYLWDSAVKIDGAKLLADLTREARELDALLKAGGPLRRHAESLARDTAKDKDRHGGALYELLYDTYNLAAAAAHVRKRDFKGAAEHVAWGGGGRSGGAENSTAEGTRAGSRTSSRRRGSPRPGSTSACSSSPGHSGRSGTHALRRSSRAWPTASSCSRWRGAAA